AAKAMIYNIVDRTCYLDFVVQHVFKNLAQRFERMLNVMHFGLNGVATRFVYISKKLEHVPALFLSVVVQKFSRVYVAFGFAPAGHAQVVSRRFSFHLDLLI